jgi:hypothetical protein
MSEYSAIVEETRMAIKAEEWGMSCKSMHAHKLDSMSYDDRPQDTDKGTKSVLDIEYNGGWIERYQDDVLIHTFGKKLGRRELLDAYGRSGK